MNAYGIGIETSCDETGIAVVKNGTDIIVNLLYSQIEIHSEFGGVIPEAASRAHLEKITYLLKEAVKKIPGGIKKIDYIAVTTRPGLVGSLLVGFNTALAISHYIKKPVIPINHLEAHIYSINLTKHNFNYPFLALLISGGNTAIYYIKGLGKIETIGATLDDACGEALDKAASLLKLPYPGGPHIEKHAKLFLQKNIDKKISKDKLDKKNPLPVILKDQSSDSFLFSFSGIKTALLYLLKSQEVDGKYKGVYYSKDALAYYFQERLFNIIRRNAALCIKKYKVKELICGGGVMANSTLKKYLIRDFKNSDIQLIIPPAKLCTDNDAIIAATGYLYNKTGRYKKAKTVNSRNNF